MLKSYPESYQLRTVLECAAAMERDPDAYFTGDYDWYSTGSSLAIMDDKWLLHVQTQNGLMNRLCKFFFYKYFNLKLFIFFFWLTGLSKMSHSKGKIRIKPQASIQEISEDLETFGNIYELRTNEHHLSVRQKTQITIIDPVSHFKHASFTSEVPFVSSDFDTHSGNVITSDAKRIVSVWDLGTQKPIQTTSEELTSVPFAPCPDQWSCIRQCSPHIFAYFDRRSVRLFDIRSSISDTKCLLMHRMDRELDDCEVISCAEMVPSRSTIIVGTTHKLFAIDLRMDKAELSTRMKWVHQMQTRPTMLSVSDQPDGELIFVSGQKTGDIRLCETKIISDDVIISPFLPRCPKSINDSYHVARRMGHLMDATSCVRDQILMSTTGLAEWKSHLITQNSMGDLIAQHFRFRPATPNNDPPFDVEPRTIAEAMTEWEGDLANVVNTTAPFYCTELVDVRPLADILGHNVTNPNGIGGCHPSDVNANESVVETRQRYPKWRQTIKRLDTYVDALAKGMLSPWDIPITEADTVDLNVPAKTTLTAVRIANWLEDSVAKDEPKTIDAEAAATQQLNESTLSSIRLSGVAHRSDSTQLSTMQTRSSRMPVTSTQIDSPASVQKPPKKKMRQSRVFVPGF